MQDCLGVPLNAYRHGIATSDFLWVNLDLDDRSVGRNVSVVVEGRGLAQPGAGGQDDVRPADGFDTLGCPQTSQVAQKVDHQLERRYLLLYLLHDRGKGQALEKQSQRYE